MRRVLLKALATACLLDGAIDLGVAAYNWWTGAGAFPLEWRDRILAVAAIYGGIMLFRLSRQGCVVIMAWAFAQLGFIVYYFLTSVYTGSPFDFRNTDDLYYYGLSIGLIGLLFIVIILFLSQRETRRLCR